eukprot:CAMPEP_0117503304 /NCGR_PEP_ID=MMETSP0784-20121206/24260_1 /TAXON_ID=39447 /ORGANISM="" /LENGTH=58 /DNA_ID=CAMNT_0005298615 /DNA_START=86 /DNA_END=259 /DNA_ORIENTATION=-
MTAMYSSLSARVPHVEARAPLGGQRPATVSSRWQRHVHRVDERDDLVHVHESPEEPHA